MKITLSGLAVAAFNLLEPEYIIEWLSIAAPLTAQLRQAIDVGNPVILHCHALPLWGFSI